VTILLYVAVGIWLLIKGWPLRAGLTMGAISLLPLIWQIKFTDSEALGFGFLLIWMLPIPILLTAVGVIAPVVRWVHRLVKARAAEK
jgi:hypothetical protein